MVFMVFNLHIAAMASFCCWIPKDSFAYNQKFYLLLNKLLFFFTPDIYATSFGLTDHLLNYYLFKFLITDMKHSKTHSNLVIKLLECITSVGREDERLYVFRT